MTGKALAAALLGMLLATPAAAQTALSAYADENGYIDVQKLTCAQLAGSSRRTPTC